jgi:hypothetical protein
LDIAKPVKCLGFDHALGALRGSAVFPTETGYLNVDRRMQIVRDVWGKLIYVRSDIGWLGEG